MINKEKYPTLKKNLKINKTIKNNMNTGLKILLDSKYLKL